MIENPFKSNVDKPQHISWKHLKEDKEYYLELIQPFNAILQEASREGAYMITCAEVLEDQEMNITTITKGHLIVIDFAVKTFSRAWVATPKHFRTQFNEKHNLRIKFIKHSKQALTIVSVEKVDPTQEHIDFGKEVYDNKEEYLPKKSKEGEHYGKRRT